MNKELENLIKDKVKLKISISNFQKEDIVNMKKGSKNVMKSAAVACLLVVSVTGVAFAGSISDFVKNLFGFNVSDGVDTAVKNGYVANVNTEYQNADGIEISIDSMTMDDFNFAMNFNVKLNEKYNIDEFERMTFEDLKIVDETGRIVFNTRSVFDTNEEIEKSYKGSYSIVPIKKNDNEITVYLTATGSTELFPKSKHLTVTLSKITTRENENTDDKVLCYEGNWKFELDVPEEFYNRETIRYKAKKCSDDGINIDNIQAVLSVTSLKIAIPEITTDKIDYELYRGTPTNISDKMAIQGEYVETSDGKKFETSQRSDGDGGYGVPAGENKIVDYHQTFNLTKYDATDTITVHMFTNKGEEIIIELERMN